MYATYNVVSRVAVVSDATIQYFQILNHRSPKWSDTSSGCVKRAIHRVILSTPTLRHFFFGRHPYFWTVVSVLGNKDDSWMQIYPPLVFPGHKAAGCKALKTWTPKGTVFTNRQYWDPMYGCIKLINGYRSPFFAVRSRLGCKRPPSALLTMIDATGI